MTESRKEKRTMEVTRRRSLVVLIAAAGAVATGIPLLERLRALWTRTGRPDGNAPARARRSGGPGEARSAFGDAPWLRR